jgi:hypothetical protein
MNEFLIIGSGFSALTSYFYLKKYNPTIISCDSNFLYRKDLISRDNLKVNKLFSEKSKSFGNFNYNLQTNTNIHDRLSIGGNSNIWGGFIDITNIPDNIIKLFNSYNINFVSLDSSNNGYNSNQKYIRQIRDKNNQILNTRNILQNIELGFVHSIKFKKINVPLQITHIFPTFTFF